MDLLEQREQPRREVVEAPSSFVFGVIVSVKFLSLEP
jgi:hypothetical protein